jgi:hypothetical protein
LGTRELAEGGPRACRTATDRSSAAKRTPA